MCSMALLRHFFAIYNDALLITFLPRWQHNFLEKCLFFLVTTIASYLYKLVASACYFSLTNVKGVKMKPYSSINKKKIRPISVDVIAWKSFQGSKVWFLTKKNTPIDFNTVNNDCENSHSNIKRNPHCKELPLLTHYYYARKKKK